ncbi:hypothetical protein COT72_02305 [archaeon CG10_big_fil_rev_8_21_14_0_10_43_11]|nr:MAG: hypothetical protein COT72_02305 [archaeon CG10_big_fil_rev_8_21_14_0_10_43_11]
MTQPEYFGLTRLLDAYPESMDVTAEMRTLMGFVTEGDYLSKELVQNAAKTTHFDTRHITELDVHLVVLSLNSLFNALPRTYTQGFTRQALKTLSATRSFAKDFVIPYLEAREAILADKVNRPKPRLILQEKQAEYRSKQAQSEKRLLFHAYYKTKNFQSVFQESRDTVKKAIEGAGITRGFNHLGILNLEHGFETRTKSLLEHALLSTHTLDYAGHGTLSLAHYFEGEYYPTFHDEVFWRPVYSITPVVQCKHEKKNKQYCDEPARFSFTLPTFEIETSSHSLVSPNGNETRHVELVKTILGDRRAIRPVYTCPAGHRTS